MKYEVINAEVYNVTYILDADSIEEAREKFEYRNGVTQIKSEYAYAIDNCVGDYEPVVRLVDTEGDHWGV